MVNLKKARSQYITRQQEHDKAKEAAQKAESESISQSAGATRADKKRKQEEEAMHRVSEAEKRIVGMIIRTGKGWRV